MPVLEFHPPGVSVVARGRSPVALTLYISVRQTLSDELTRVTSLSEISCLAPVGRDWQHRKYFLPRMLFSLPLLSFFFCLVSLSLNLRVRLRFDNMPGPQLRPDQQFFFPQFLSPLLRTFSLGRRLYFSEFLLFPTNFLRF